MESNPPQRRDGAVGATTPRQVRSVFKSGAIMFFVRCQFCHKLVFRPFYESHRAKHTALLPDGQMTDHISVHPSGRYQGPLDDVPQVYVHPQCGVATGMPEEIIRSYLVNPFLYSGRSFCCGCNDYVAKSELIWQETGETLADYDEGLRQAYLNKYGEPPPQRPV